MREFIKLYILARASACTGSINIRDVIYDAHQAWKVIDACSP